MGLENFHHLKRLSNAQNSFRNSLWKFLSEPQAHKYIFIYILRHGRPPSSEAGFECYRNPKAVPSQVCGRRGVINFKFSVLFKNKLVLLQSSKTDGLE